MRQGKRRDLGYKSVGIPALLPLLNIFKLINFMITMISSNNTFQSLIMILPQKLFCFPI